MPTTLLPVRNWCLAAALLIVTLSSHAQTAPAALPSATVSPVDATNAIAPLQPPTQVAGRYKDYLNKRYANDKEAKAVVHMFGRKQTGGVLWLLGGAGFLGFLASQTGTTTSGSGTSTFTITPLGYIILIGLPGGLAIGKFSRFNNGELYKTLNEYDKTHAFPGYVIAKLGRSDYQ